MRSISRTVETRPGYRQTFHAGRIDDRHEFAVETVQDITEVTEANKRRRNQVDENAKWKDEELVACIPSIVYYGPANAENPKGPRVCDLREPEFRRWLNDPDNRAFRTRHGRV